MIEHIPYITGKDNISSLLPLMIELAKPIRGTEWLLNLALTGSAGLLKLALWAEPGASANLLGEQWTYAQQHTDALIGRPPPEGRYSRMGSALAMAAAAFRQAKEIAFHRDLIDKPMMGVAMTAAVSTSRQRRGANTCRIACRTEQGWHSLDITFQKAHLREQSRTERRLEEGLLCDLLTLLLIRETIGLSTPTLDAAWGFEAGTFSRAQNAIRITPDTHHDSPLDALENPYYQVLMPDERIIPLTELDLNQYVLFPGSFAPLHHGHERMAKLAAQQTTKDIVFQLTAQHPAKGRIPVEELKARAKQLRFLWPVVIFDAEGLYVEKAERCPNMPMLIGADVVYGLQDLRFYDNDRLVRDDVFKRLSQHQSTFLVGGRDVNGHYETLYDIPIPPRFAPLFQPLGGKMNVSSSLIREKRRQ